MGASSQLPDAPGDTDPAASPFEQHGTNGANGTNGATTFNGSTAAPHQPDTSPPLPPKLSTLASKGSILRKASHTSFSMPKEDVDYPDFPEFDLTSAEIGDLEELLHRSAHTNWLFHHKHHYICRAAQYKLTQHPQYG